MKLILAVVQDKDAAALSKKFIENDVRATKLATSGGFLKAGNTTFIIGIEDDRVSDVMEIIKESSHTREQYVSPSISSRGSAMMSEPVKVTVGGATVFVLPVEEFKHF
ncbi:uncharacterized protein YaaQ [Lactobacillus colini]|uniref:Uncharacterized protein YaaQ n=1 Tax=Lactobacillus colini TaxID=1819254 RepID=A0ABS4MFR3_9LACO|nr:cyclic-di-AMP receptor [Lactobacillus colini]MBP2058530.1 uncharacterized protein YaaQ [Lactobacillus colini]